MSVEGNKRVEEYLENVCLLIKNKRVHKSVKAELLSHIEEIVENSISENCTKEEAIDKALKQLGSYNLVGSELNKVHKSEPDWIVLAITGLFMLIGMFLLGYIDNNYSGEIFSYNILPRTIIYSIIGIALAYVISKVDYKVLARYSKFIYIGTIVLMIGSLFLSKYTNTEVGYIIVGPISFKVFNLSSFLLVIALSGIFNKYDWTTIKNVRKGGGVIFLPSIFFVLGESLANLFLYFIGAFTIALISGLKLRHFFVAISGLFTLGVMGIFIDSYGGNKLGTYLTSYSDVEGAGWIYNNLAQLRNQGGLFGADKVFNPDMLPDFYTDFMLTFIMYSFGWIITFVIIALILAFVIRIGAIGASTRESYGKLLVSGLCAYFAAQFGFNILMNFTLSSTLAIGMPFISYGGSSLVVNILTVGIITSVCKWRNLTVSLE